MAQFQAPGQVPPQYHHQQQLPPPQQQHYAATTTAPAPPVGGGGMDMTMASAIDVDASHSGAGLGLRSHMSRTPPTSTPSSYGRFIPKKSRASANVGSFTGGRSMGSDKTGTSAKMSTSLSGRLRSVSDLERSGVVSAAEKGRLKDLIISGDEALRSALDKYEAGDPSELEGLISRGYLGLEGSIDIAELDSLDIGNLGLDGDLLGFGDAGGGLPGSWEYFDMLGMGGGSVDFTMDDMQLPFGGMDELEPQLLPGGTAVGGGVVGGVGGSGHPHSAHHAAPSSHVPPPSVPSSALDPSATAFVASSSTATAYSRANYAGLSGSSHQPVNTSSSASVSKRSTGLTPATAGGTTAFPNSTNSGTKFPVSNCVSELPSLDQLPQGAAPAYEQLINFQRAKSKDAIRCVMCGKAPSPPIDGEGGTVIPQQNKDVCRDCDKALWVHNESTTYFKWCKGCKRFRNIVAFSEKLDASKCNGCRERGRRSYLQRKGANGQSSVAAMQAQQQAAQQAAAQQAAQQHAHQHAHMPDPRGLPPHAGLDGL